MRLRVTRAAIAPSWCCCRGTAAMSTIREPPRTHEDLLGARGLGFGKEFGKQGKWVLAVFVPTQLEKEKKNLLCLC